jgi:plasmid maintenance system killer protein
MPGGVRGRIRNLFHNRPSGRALRFPREVADAALVKMDSLSGAASMLDLRSPPGNRLANERFNLAALRAAG